MTHVTDGKIKITWCSPSKTGGSPITGYVIERQEIVSNAVAKEGKDEDTYSWWLHETVDRYTLDYTLSGLTIGAMYSVRVAAQNSVGLGQYAEINHPVEAKNAYSVPDMPTGPIIITNITRETCDASWHAPKHDGGAPLSSYFLEKKDLHDSFWIKIARIDPDVRTLKIFNLVEGYDYQLRVSAENIHGMSEPLVSGKFRPLRIHGKFTKLP